MSLPPGPRMPGIIALLSWMRDPIKGFDELFAQYGDLYTINNPVYGREVVLGHPELIKTVLTGSPDAFHGGEANWPLRPIVGASSVLLLDGKAHARERKLLMPPFHGERMAVYANVIREATERTIAAWPNNKPFSLLPSMQRITIDVILKAVFGADDGTEIDTLRTVAGDLVDRAQRPLGMLWMMPAFQVNLGPLTGWAAIKRSVDRLDGIIHTLIKNARASGKRGADILSMLLSAVDEEGNPMTDAELRDELVTLLFAGHETSATALCWCVEEIVRRPEVHARICDEARAGTSHAYLEAVIKEVLRLRPLTPLLARRSVEPITLRNYEIPGGTYIVPCVYRAQRHPDYWEAPDEFRAERFLDKKPDPYAWLPFGGGSRRCIGMAFAMLEMRVVLATLLPRVPLRLPDAPAKVALRSFLFAPSGGPRVVVARAA